MIDSPTASTVAATPPPAVDGGATRRLNVPQAGGHLDLMIRQTRIHHMTLSISADTKANMLMIASSVVLSLAAKDLSSSKAQLPGLILTTFSLLSVCMAIFAAMPKFRLSFKRPPAQAASSKHRPQHSPAPTW